MRGGREPKIAVIAAPKPFRGHAGTIQRNALASWRRLDPTVEILLGGDVDGLAQVARQQRAICLGPIAAGVDGPPRVDDLFARAEEASRAELFAYVNSDIMLLPDWLAAVRKVASLMPRQFLAIGRRIDLDVDEIIDFDDPGAVVSLVDRGWSEGKMASRVCKDYFVFRRGAFRHVPPFTLGRAFWDNWMVHDAHHRGLPVVDITACATAIHQNHDYAHLAGGRLSAYLTSAGAQANRRLAGGSRMISGAAGSCQLLPSGEIVRPRLPTLLAFAADLPRFLGLSLSVATSGGMQWARQATFRAGSRARSNEVQWSGSRPKMPSRRAA
jgi:hypothetical protein